MSDDHLFREVDEDVRRDRFEALWKRYGRHAFAAVTLIVVVAVGVVLWLQFQERQRLAAGGQFAAAAQLAADGEPELALDEFAALADSGGRGYRLLARLRQAALLVELGDIEDAVALYDEIAADGGVDRVYQDLATLLAVMHQVDDGDPAALIARLAPMSADGNPWHFSARELTAVLAMRAGDTARARELFTDLAGDLEAPASLRARASELLAALGG